MGMRIGDGLEGFDNDAAQCKSKDKDEGERCQQHTVLYSRIAAAAAVV